MAELKAAPVEMGFLLSRVSLQLKELQRDGRVVEDAIARSLLGDELSIKENLANLQGIDAIVQTLGELEKYIGNLSNQACREHLVDINFSIREIKLRDLARSLVGPVTEAIVDGDGGISGEVDLF
ncbi:hypothetical protein [Phaeobacter sp. 22II1-1F12B]|uniref:hypothetical protein n=1 Tax=Phaeobacter sp. 22II1-1F12B TaxID=1317111 RepID=UPI000B51FCA4|nr:hypothetical protein [Phaeobacter sp. 22II1-1F12B]OWU73054.1 hypothetical protein ATO1_21085 [Phaeobacter sp. 22II1-1F12B]